MDVKEHFFTRRIIKHWKLWVYHSWRVVVAWAVLGEWLGSIIPKIIFPVFPVLIIL